MARVALPARLEPLGQHEPQRIPEFQLILRFQSDGDTTNWRLSSDAPGDPAGRTLHADWFGAWDPDVLTTWTQECVNARRSCNAGEIGDGRQLLTQ